jgi:FkbM family methyltransferase
MKMLLKRYVPAPLWNVLRSLRKWVDARKYSEMIKTYQRHVVSHVYAGYPLQIAIGDPVGKEWYDKDLPNLPELDLLSSHKLQPGARVFDIGAHQGVVALIISRMVGNTGTVFALDPNPTNIELASESRRLNNAGNLTLIQAAAGSCKGSVRFGHQLNDLVSQDLVGYDVDVVTVDDLASEHGYPNVVFIDVEGFEGEVLKGASVTREKCVSDWFVEVHMNGSLQGFGWTYEQILQFFPPERYSRFIASENERVFQSINAAQHLLNDRFFFVAIDNRRG